MAITKFTLIEPGTPGLHYTAIVETDGDLVPLERTAYTADQETYTLSYKSVPGAHPRTDTWDMDIIFTGVGQRYINYRIVDETGREIHDHEDKPPVRDGR
ncbi:MAG: hypothetical protein KA791_07745 [Flavobacteriales bacterium]|nr:hypothetical protein [Flavobacteriales bacterium]